MIVTIEAFFRKIWRQLSPEEWMRRFLNLPREKETGFKPGLVMIQIDGLGFTQGERAIQKGNMPFLARLLKKERYGIHRHYSGLPSNTPAVQGRLFYGVKACVPAFSYKDRRSGKVFNMFNPESAAAVENCIKEKCEPLLKEGSAYGNIFTGGAKEAHFCVSSMGWGGLLKAANPLSLFFTLLMNFHVFIRALFLILLELILAVVGSIRGMLSGKNFLVEVRFIPLRVAVCVLLREVIAAGARIDIARGLPVIHINLAGYDEQAHHRGPKSAFAHWSLRGIDSAISKIWKAAQRSLIRHYEVFVYSDHGQEETISYPEENGRSVQEAVNKIFEERNLWKMEYTQHAPYWRASLLWNRSGERPKTTSLENKDVPLRAVVAAMGSVGHIYLPETLTAEEKEKIALQLVATAKIPIVMVPDGPGQALAWNSGGKFVLPGEADKVIEIHHPFFKEVARDLVELCHHPDSGDLMILGWKKGPRSLTFAGEQGSHAGPGPEETSGFALLPMGALSRVPKETICTQDLRDAAFRAQGRENENVCTAPECSEPVTGPVVLRIMTYNVHSCTGRDGKISPNRIAGIIARHNPDIIALQELMSGDSFNQAQDIAQKLSMTFHFHPSLSVKKGVRGNAIFSKFPVRLVKDGYLPKLPRMPFLEPRGALWVELDVRGEKVQVLNTHLSLSSAERLLQMKALLGPEWMRDPRCLGSVILCGDFNASAQSKIFESIGPGLKNTQFDLNGHHCLKTLPSFYPLGLVDHIFVGSGLKTIKIEVPRTELEKVSSDHLPLIADVRIG